MALCVTHNPRSTQPLLLFCVDDPLDELRVQLRRLKSSSGLPPSPVQRLCPAPSFRTCTGVDVSLFPPSPSTLKKGGAYASASQSRPSKQDIVGSTSLLRCSGGVSNGHVLNRHYCAKAPLARLCAGGLDVRLGRFGNLRFLHALFQRLHCFYRGHSLCFSVARLALRRLFEALYPRRRQAPLLQQAAKHLGRLSRAWNRHSTRFWPPSMRFKRKPHYAGVFTRSTSCKRLFLKPRISCSEMSSADSSAGGLPSGARCRALAAQHP